VPAAELYWTDQPVRFTVWLPLLKISMKSFVKTAPVLPPPPYTWLMTRPEVFAAGALGVAVTSLESPLGPRGPFALTT
jgi:hypothetical protein